MMGALRTSKSIAIIVGALAGILGLSVASVQREQARLVDEFTAATRQQVHDSVEVLSARLEALDQDTRVLTDLVERTSDGKAADPLTERRIQESTFRALAVVVAHYRVIALIDRDGSVDVVAADPSEAAATVAALMPHARRLAAKVIDQHTRALGHAAQYGGRSFLFYGTPVRDRRAIVVASDTATLLGAIAWTALPAARLYVTDPAGVVWGGCETAGHCRATASGTVPDQLELAASPPRRTGGRGARMDPAPPLPVVRVSERADRATGAWVVTWLASTQPIVERQRSRVSQVVLTAMAAAIAVAAGGAVLLRQQRKAVELEERLHYAQALANARETSESIVENAPLGVLGVSKEGRVVIANSFLSDRLGPIRTGAPLEEAFPGMNVEWIGALEPLLVTELAPSGPGVSPQEIRSIVTGSQQFHVRIVRVRNHAIGVRAFALVEDQSELRNLQNQLVRAEKLITVGVLSAGIAHEIGSPLAVIRGRAEQVLRALGGGSPRAEDMRVIIKHIDHIASTIRQVLDFSRRQPIERRAVPLQAAVDRALGLLQWKSEAKRVPIEVALAPGLPPLAADPDQLQQLFVNLLLNACDASREGERVSIAATPTAEGAVRIEVADRGCGIAPEHMNTVFDPFFTTKKRGEGTGLGLTIAAGIVHNHAGQINLASTPGRGTTVTVIWPAAAHGARAADDVNPHDGDADLARHA
jgi:signal transduction histidine kinase